MTECGVAPIEFLGFGVDQAGSRALDVLAWVENLIPLEVQTSKRAQQNIRAAFELGRESVLARRSEPDDYRPALRVRHLKAVSQ